MKKLPSFSLFPLFFGLSLLLNLSYSASLAEAATAYFNRTLYPANALAELNNWQFKDAAGYCYRRRGRVFTFSHDFSFPLVGLSVLVMVEGRNEARFDPSNFRLSLFQGLTTLASNASPSFSPVIERGGDGSATFDVYFPLPGGSFFDGSSTYRAVLECLTDEENFYRVWEATSLKTGNASYYNSTSQEEEPYYDSQKKILFSLFRPKDSSVYPALAKQPTPPNQAPPKFHPVVLIHGMGGRPENFKSEDKNMNYVKMLQDLGYPADYVHLYSYGYKAGQYNYQGDIREIAANLESVVRSLSTLHKSQGGDGRVDLVGHSLGTLVARYYLNTHQSNHSVRKFIAAGAPFKGSWIMDLDQNVKEIPGVGKRIERQMANLLTLPLKKFGVFGRDQPLTPDSPAAQQVISSSSFLTEMNHQALALNDVQIHLLYGDVNLTLEQKVFKRSIRKKASIGDGVVLPESATYFPGTNPNLLAFSETATAHAKLIKNIDASFSISWPELDSIRIMHTVMLTAESIKSKIKEILTSN